MSIHLSEFITSQELALLEALHKSVPSWQRETTLNTFLQAESRNEPGPRECGASHPDDWPYTCTRAGGHTGPHVCAVVHVQVCSVWE